MIRRVVAGVAGLGLIGGVGAVSHGDNGTTKVTVQDKHGHKESVVIGGGNGRMYSCPLGTRGQLDPIDIRAGRVKITLRHVRKSLHTIEARYPGHRAPGRVVDRYHALGRRESRLVKAYNVQIDQHNAVLDSRCTPEA